MTIQYITALCYPVQHAHGLQVMKMSEAFARIFPLELFVAEFHAAPSDIFSHYGISTPFPIKTIPQHISFWPRSLFVARALVREIEKNPNGVFYIRDLLLAFFLLFFSPSFGRRYFFEIHSVKKFPNFIYKKVLENARGIISTNLAKKRFIISRYRIQSDTVLVAPNGFDKKLFDNVLSQEAARQKAGLPVGKKIIMYVGSTQKWKGTDMIFKIAGEFPGALFIIVGGDHRSERGVNVMILPPVPPAEVPIYLRAADILLAPYNPGTERAMKYFSPIKLFEYMASGVPIVITKMASIQEVFSEKYGAMVESYTREAFCAAIKEILENADDSRHRAEEARRHAEQFSWEKRAFTITQFMQK